MEIVSVQLTLQQATDIDWSYLYNHQGEFNRDMPIKYKIIQKVKQHAFLGGVPKYRKKIHRNSQITQFKRV